MPQKSLACRGCLQVAIVCQRYERIAVKMFWAITVLRERQSLEKRLEAKRKTNDERSVCDFKNGLNLLKSSNNQALRGKFAGFF